LKKQLMIAIGVLLALNTAVAGNDAQVAKRPAVSQSMSTDIGLQAAAEVVSLWKHHANAAASTPLARPL
jgi:hypothetical protein